MSSPRTFQVWDRYFNPLAGFQSTSASRDPAFITLDVDGKRRIYTLTEVPVAQEQYVFNTVSFGDAAKAMLKHQMEQREIADELKKLQDEEGEE